MAKTLDFNTLQLPTLEVVLRDDECTHFKLGMPSEGLVEELNGLAPELTAALKDDSAEELAKMGKECLKERRAERTAAIYDLAARVFSYNRDGIRVTAEELRGKYRMDLESLVVFFGAYFDFLNEISNAKN